MARYTGPALLDRWSIVRFLSALFIPKARKTGAINAASALSFKISSSRFVSVVFMRRAAANAS
jgi:hypothetical protein